MEEARAREKNKLNELKNTLYDQQRKMQNIQSELEVISAKNSVLEQDFENEINKKNQNSKEIGQIINSINNIFNICKIQQAKRGKKLDKQDVRIREGDKDLVEQLQIKLDRAHQTVDELVKVYREYGQDYNREKAYAEDIDVTMGHATSAKYGQSLPGNRGTNQGQSTLPGHESTGMKTAKLQSGAANKPAGSRGEGGRGADLDESNR